MAQFARMLRPGGEFRFATDWPDYAAWTLGTADRIAGIRMDGGARRRLAAALAGFHQHALRSQGQAGRTRAVLPDLPARRIAISSGFNPSRPDRSAAPARIARRAVPPAATAVRNWRRRRPIACRVGFLSTAQRVITACAVDQSKPAALHRISTGSVCSPVINRSTTSMGIAHIIDSAAAVSSNFSAVANEASWRSSSRPIFCSPSTACCAGRKSIGLLGSDLARHLGQHAADLRPGFRPRGGEQALLHQFRRPHHQVTEDVCRDIGPPADPHARMSSRSARSTRRLNPVSESLAPRLAATCRATCWSPRVDQDVGDRLRQSSAVPRSPADGPGPCCGRSRPDRRRQAVATVSTAARRRQYRRRAASRLHDANRRIVDRRQPCGEFGQGARLDLFDQTAEHLVEQRDVVLADMWRRHGRTGR